ncbi:MAG: HAD-IIIC family phosphatase [Planctomycetota bacterium]
MVFSTQTRLKFFYEAQKSPELLKSIRLEVQGKDPATELLLDLLQEEDYANIFPRFQSYLAQSPADGDWLGEVVSYLLKKEPSLLKTWLATSPETGLSESVLLQLFKHQSRLEILPKIRVGLIRKQSTVFLQQSLWLHLLRYQLPAQILTSSLDSFRSLKDPQHPFYQEPLNFLWITLGPEDILPLSEWEHDSKRVLELFISWVESALKWTSADLLISTFLPPLLPKHFVKGNLFQQYQSLNYELFQYFGNHSRISFLDTEQLLRVQGEKIALDRFRSVYALAPESFSFAWTLSRWSAEWIRQNSGQIRKCLVLDLDGTLWGGSLDEDQIRIGPEYPGNSYYHFQQSLKTLSRAGFLLAINSKNDRTQVLNAFQNTPEMPLKIEDFACIEADWQEKPEKMRTLQHKLGLSLDSFIFLENDPRERFLMRQCLPQVLTPELPIEEYKYIEFIYSIPELARFKLTEDDQHRTQSYLQETRRKELALSSETHESFLTSLGLIVSLELAENRDFERLAQLSKRVNQFHFTGHRLAGEYFLQQPQNPQVQFWSVEAKDHFGDYGCVGFLQTRKTEILRVEEFFLSCRILGRGVEKALLNWISKQTLGVPLWVFFQKTERNHQAFDFIQQLKTQPAGEAGFLEILEIPACPSWIQNPSIRSF